MRLVKEEALSRLILFGERCGMHSQKTSPIITKNARTVVAAFTQGATAEQIAHDYPVLSLVDIYPAITFYLRQREAVEEYLAEQERAGQHIHHQMEARFDPHGICHRLLARRTTRDQQDASAPGG